MFGGLGVMELVVVLVIATLFFGPKRLPELGRGIGEAIRNFKKASTEPDDSPPALPRDENPPSSPKEGA